MAQENENVNGPQKEDPPQNEKPIEKNSDESNGKEVSKDGEENHDGDLGVGSVFQVSVKLPHEPFQVQVMVSTQEQVQDLRQSIVELPNTFQYTCFHLEHKGKRINDFVELSEVPDLEAGSELVLVEDPYSEKEARMHMLRLRELLGVAGDRPDLLHGICSGASLHDVLSSPGGSKGDKTNGKSTKETEPGHDLHGYDLKSPASLQSILPPSEKPAPKMMKALALSPWNPPPHHLRQKGHLLYLQITTNEGEQFQITSHVSGFYVNNCSNNKFDPSPRTKPKVLMAHSLLTLMSMISPSFDTSFSTLQNLNIDKDPLTTFQPTNAVPASPWVVPTLSSQSMVHQSDITRTQETTLISGIENSESLRDWNEEFQSTRELPRESVQDRVFRERLTSKLFADYNEAAARGAVLVARGEVSPLNPTEGPDAQIFIYNNIFFSYGADGVGTFASEGGDEAARVAVGKDVMGVKAVNQLDIPGLFTPGTVVVDYLGKRLVGQSIVPGIFKQREPGEHQIDYGGVEGKEVVAENEVFVPVFQKLSEYLRVKKHPVWDKDGKRHDLEGSVETKGLIGTDGRKYVLDLYRITPLDVKWLEENWKEPEAEKHEIKSDYPHRMAVLRPELIEGYFRFKRGEFIAEKLKSQPQKEIKESDEKNADSDTKDQTGAEKTTDAEKATDEEKAKDAEKATDAAEKDTDAVADTNVDGENSKETAEQAANVDGENTQDQVDAVEKAAAELNEFDWRLNPDVWSGQTADNDKDREEFAKDEKEVRAVCNYLLDSILPEMVQNLKEGEVGFPMDGQSLSRLMHKRGVNIRYLGEVAKLATPDEPRLHALRVIAVQEMISRAFKHIANRYLRHLPSIFSPACIAYLLNCLLGLGLNPNPKPEMDKMLRSLYPEGDFSFESVKPAELQKEIEAQVNQRYRFTLDKDWHSSIKHVQMLREIALKLGLQLEIKDFIYTRPTQTNGHTPSSTTNGANSNTDASGGKKKKKSRDSSPTNKSDKEAGVSLTFQADDILNIVPLIKDASPRSGLAEEALEAGRMSILQNQKELGQELLLESLSLHEQIYGILHPEVARLYHQLSMLYYQLGEKGAAAELANKAVIISERMIGIDSAETVLSYLNLALFEHANGDTECALAYMKHALNLWKVIYGVKHPDLITTLNNAAVMLQHMKQYHESRLWFESSLELSEDIYGKQSINTATLLFQLAQALALDQDSKGAVNRMREAYNIFLNKLGANDRNTKEAESWLEQLTQNAVSIAKHAKDLQARKLRRMQLHPRVTLGTKPQPQVGQTANGSTKGDGKGGKRMDSRSIDELLKFIEGDSGSTRSTKQKRPTPTNPKRRLH
ncbi:MAG: Intracellular distribution of mitochondria [Cirrosporium novae-zelandiae]|nr:MAG: Intracellular distribution of mitochondria [Cirrosporium novae-zelandiae]